MRVLLIIARFEFGGIPNQAFLWAKFLSKNKFEPIIVSQYTVDCRYLELLKKNNIPYGFLDSTKNSGLISTLMYLYKFSKEIQSFKADYIFPFNSSLGYHVNFIWRFTSAKKCFYLDRNHGKMIYNSFSDKCFKILSIHNSSGMIYNSEAAATFSLIPKRTIVIKNTFKIAGPKDNTVYSIERIGGDTLMFLHIANIVSQKNYQLIIDSWKNIRMLYPTAVLFIIGSDIKNSQSDITVQFDQDGIFWEGSVANVFPYIKRANICLLSSHHEGCPNVILEYVSQKKLIVASDIPSIREVLDPSNFKYLFDNTSILDLIVKIKKLLELEDDYKEELLEANYKKLLLNYSESNYNKLLELLR